MKIIKNLLLLSLVGFVASISISCESSKQSNSEGGNSVQKIVAEFVNPHSDKVLVTAHRGDWRNWPENSIPAIESAIKMGVDIVEIDIKLTADSVLVICHDDYINRTTNGKGRVCDLTYDYISQCFLKTGHGIVTEYRMPTLAEALEVCKGRIMVNVDQGYEYYDLVLAIAERLSVTDQIVIKGKNFVETVEEDLAKHPHNMLYMPNIHITSPAGKALFDNYQESGVVPFVCEFNYSELTPDVISCMDQLSRNGTKLWMNTLWASQSAGLCDDAAYLGDPDEIYGKLIDMGARVIQTDRPEFLLNYLRKKGLHD